VIYYVTTSSDLRIIEKVEADVTVQNVEDIAEQKFSIKFITADAPLELSGNPGYHIGKPLLVLSGDAILSPGLRLQGRSRTGTC